LNKCIELCTKLVETPTLYLFTNLTKVLEEYQAPVSDIYDFLLEEKGEEKLKR